MESTWHLSHAHAHVSIFYDQAKEVVLVKWKGHINAEDVLLAAKAYLALQEKWKCPRLLNDKSEVTGDWEEANNWLEYEWLPDAVRLGMRKFAHVLSPNFQQVVSAKDMIARFAQHCEASMFWDPALAEEWLCRPLLSPPQPSSEDAEQAS
ncbi:hypothetical protein GU926_06760 [Nibribacter ruber]|uniref:STAS/SEC14 domain-containing protein n=1 Tax=Nibribacter ruber TaxID=2698458 RepID=A0A6P1NTU5_9BACT|nr:hypothetical protein [Nibribacter ruber]QHL87147.1 hypothetical protein GU926_06760 [Nibribacter ruber]